MRSCCKEQYVVPWLLLQVLVVVRQLDCQKRLMLKKPATEMGAAPQRDVLLKSGPGHRFFLPLQSLSVSAIHVM